MMAGMEYEKVHVKKARTKNPPPKRGQVKAKIIGRLFRSIIVTLSPSTAGKRWDLVIRWLKRQLYFRFAWRYWRQDPIILKCRPRTVFLKPKCLDGVLFVYVWKTWSVETVYCCVMFKNFFATCELTLTCSVMYTTASRVTSCPRKTRFDFGIIGLIRMDSKTQWFRKE